MAVDMNLYNFKIRISETKLCPLVHRRREIWNFKDSRLSNIVYSSTGRNIRAAVGSHVLNRFISNET